MDVERDTSHARGRHGAQAAERQFDLNKLLNSTACNISLGIILLLIGIVVTVMTFMEHRATNKIFLLGPILVGAGVLGVGKAVLKKYRFGDIDQRRRRRRRSCRVNRTMENQDATINSLSISGEQNSPFRNTLDDPPPYNVISLLNPQNALLPTTQIQNNSLTETILPKYSENDPLPPPPKYEEAVVDDAGEINVSYTIDDASRMLETFEHLEDIQQDSTRMS